MTRVAIVQSNYIPWRGYFDLIRRVDHFVFYDTAQFTKNDWRNRNKIITKTGELWLTVPVATAGQFGQSIDTVQISAPNWATHHYKSLQSGLGRAPRYKEGLGPRLEEWYQSIGQEKRLSFVNRFLIKQVMHLLGIQTQLHDAANLDQTGDKTGRLVSICKALGATHYLSGPSARVYLDQTQFEAARIQVEWMEYPEYPAYAQMDGGYRQGVSVFDTLAYLRPEEVFF